MIPNKIPSALEIFLNTAAFDDTSVFLPAPAKSAPIESMVIPFGYYSSYDGGINFAQYGRCTTTPDTPTVSYFTSFAVPEGIQNTASSIEPTAGG